MTTGTDQSKSQSKVNTIARYFPFLDWLVHYDRANLSGDVIAGLIVTVMLVPQSMAYALLAGLPPEVGIYASILPLLIYGLMGSSRVLAVGPVAIVSLMVASGVSQHDPATVAEYVALATTLALMVGVIQLLLGAFRAGFLVNFLSHPVLAGFINAAALIIAVSQVKHLLGISVPRQEHFYETIVATAEHLPNVNWATVTLSLLSIATLVVMKRYGRRILSWLGIPGTLVPALAKSGPFIVVAFSVTTVALVGLDTRANVAIVGDVPAGLPAIGLPAFSTDTFGLLLPTALAIALVGFMESISVAKSLASKRRQKVDANQELIAVGSANLGAALTGAYPVAGGIGRSVVNFSAGANTGLASIITALLMGVTVMFLTPLFYYLPQATLASIIVVAVAGLFDWSVFRSTWDYSKSDALSLMITFGAALVFGIEMGILYGVGAGILLYLWRTSQPHYAIVGRVGETEHFRNVQRHDVTLYPGVLAIRVDESLYFPNAQYLETILLSHVADDAQIEHLLLICSAVNYIDSSALEVLESLIVEMRDSNVSFSLAEVKGPVMDKLRTASFIEHIGPENIYLSTHQAIEALTGDQSQTILTEPSLAT